MRVSNRNGSRIPLSSPSTRNVRKQPFVRPSAVLRLGNTPSVRPQTKPVMIRPAATMATRLAQPMLKQDMFLARRQGRNGTVQVAATLAEDAPAAAERLEKLLKAPLPVNPQLKVGKLKNGFEYVILPNPMPPQRFEAHLEVHGGSVDETEEEQGIAHVVEHVTFLGSRKREELLGTGARSNAYTDFHHTVFHYHCPVNDVATGEPMLPRVLEALEDVAFHPEFLSTRIEKERKAVLSEAQMMNTIEYRIDCQLLQYLHSENALGFRFPIGKTDLVRKFTADQIRAFWQRWYFPANMTLYVVGELEGGVEATERLIEQIFGGLEPRREATVDAEGKVQMGALVPRQPVRPPVVHKYGVGLATPDKPVGVSIFRHPLLPHFQLSMFCKLPTSPIVTFQDLRYSFIVRIIIAILQFRINSRHAQVNPPFVTIEMDSSDAGREGCTVSTLTITAEPKTWREAVEVAIQEVRCLQQFGVTASELSRYKGALLRDSEQLAQQSKNVNSVDQLNFVMESLALGHTAVDSPSSHEALLTIADSITVEEVSAVAKSLLSYISHYGREAELKADFAANRPAWTYEPSRATAIVACVPAYVDPSGQSANAGSGALQGRGASLTTMQHVEVNDAILDSTSDPLEDATNALIPEGSIKFELSAEDIESAIRAEGLEVNAVEDVDVPDQMISDAELAAMLQKHEPHFVPVRGATEAETHPDPITGVVQRRLQNGVRVNYRETQNEPGAAVMRLVAAGGRAREKLEIGPTGLGSVAVGVRAASESGTVGPWKREQVELFCVSRLINCVLEADEEWVVMDFHFPVADGGLRGAFEILHLFLEAPRWDPIALERAKQMYTSHYKALSKSLERATGDRVLEAMLGKDRRFRDPSPEEIQGLELEALKALVMEQLTAGNLELNVVGDFDPDELEDCLLCYLGTLSRPTQPLAPEAPVQPLPPTPATQNQRWHLKDSDERACAYIAGFAPPRWDASLGVVTEIVPPVLVPPTATPEVRMAAMAQRRRHPLYRSVSLQLLSEIMNSRLFTTVRDSLGLTYDVSYELALFDRLQSGWFSVNVTSQPSKIDQALNACLRVLRGVRTSPISPRELDRARRTLITRHETDLEDNNYWVGLLTHIQSDQVPNKRLECLRDLVPLYEACTVEDMYDIYNMFDWGNLYTCIGTSGPQAAPATAGGRPAGAAAGEWAELGFGLSEDGAGGAAMGVPAGADPQAFFSAMAQALKNPELLDALKKLQQGKAQGGDQQNTRQ